ncbi:MAG: hypothetical protein GY765_26210 [bacterium]|nr:hypothetical protein [bacterium]
MKKNIIFIFLMWMSLVFVYPAAAGVAGQGKSPPNGEHRLPNDIMKLSDVKKGMVGEGRTIFKGTKIETFKFRVLGVLENFSPGKNLIIVEVEDCPELTEAGIIQGMSGSPAYIDGKMIGAIAYGFPYARRPIGGVTPIEEILDTDNFNRSNATIDISNIKVDFQKENVQSIGQLLKKELSARLNFTPHASLAPIKLMGLHKGMAPQVLNALSPFFTTSGTISSGSARRDTDLRDKRKLTGNSKMFTMEPADVAVVPLIRGDFEYSVSGTVTYVRDNKVYHFGHPFFNLGAVEFPLHKAEVITVVPSFQSSFKMVATGNMVGTVIQDRFSSMQAELGRKPYMIPMKIFLENKNRSFNVELAQHPMLTPLLTNYALANVFISQYKEVGFASLRVKGKIFIKKKKNIIIDDLYSGTVAVQELGGLLMAANFFLMNNPDKHVKIQKLDFEISGSEKKRSARIENVIINKTAFYPGELIDIGIHLKSERSSTRTESIQIKAPNLKAGSGFYLLVGDKNAIVGFENRNTKIEYFPSKLSDLIRAINNLRKNNRIYLKLMTPTDGVFIKGHEYSNLPGSMRNMYVFNTKSKAQSKIKFSTITEYQLPVPAVVKGSKLFKLQIKERSDIDVP